MFTRNPHGIYGISHIDISKHHILFNVCFFFSKIHQVISSTYFFNKISRLENKNGQTEREITRICDKSHNK